jgi:arylsulfatase
LPGHERLTRTGTTFHQHYTSATMCTSSRAVLLTGLQTADNRMFDNADMPYIKAMSPSIPTIGHMLRKAGYVTSYKGKWHLDPAFDQLEPERVLTKDMEAYGFADYVWPGDVVGHTLGGYNFDHVIGASATAWLRRKGRPLSDDGKPWAMFVSLVNPHDIMYFNTDAPGERIQDTGNLIMHAARAPEHELFRSTWNVPLPKSLRQDLAEAGRPRAHGEFVRAWAYMLGSVPPHDAPWRRFTDYYYNCIRSVDAQLAGILTELDRLGLSENTIVVYTADHGEMGGAHGLRGKGPFAYEEAIHVPLKIVHPDVRGGRGCRALTSHIDMVPSLLAMAGVDATKTSELAGRDLPGKNVASVLADPGRRDAHALNEGVLFTYSGIGTNDSEMIRLVSEAKAARQDPKAAIKASGYRPDMKKRGSLRTVFDGQHKFTRYFAPVERNRPAGIDELFATNDVELFDLKADPAEMKNLAARKGENAALVMAMSGKLERQIKAQIGADDGREMPVIEGIDWTIDSLDL